RLRRSRRKSSRTEIDENVLLLLVGIGKTQQEAVAEPDMIGADRQTLGRRWDHGVLSHSGAGKMQFRKMRLSVGWLVEKAILPKVVKPGSLPRGIFYPVSDLIFQLTIFVEDQRGAA